MDPTLGSEHQIYRLLDVFCPIQLNIMPSDSVYYSYVANLAYPRSSEIVEARILAQYSRIFEYLYSFEHEYSRVSNTRIFVGYSRVLHKHTRTNASIYLWITLYEMVLLKLRWQEKKEGKFNKIINLNKFELVDRWGPWRMDWPTEAVIVLKGTVIVFLK